MSLYTNDQNFTPAAADTMNHILASASVQAALAEWCLGSEATPVEQAGKYRIARTTTTGTTPAGSTTVVKVNTMGPAAACTAGGGGYTTEPTVGDIFQTIPVHQKATFRWVAYPGREFRSAPTANNGVAVI